VEDVRPHYEAIGRIASAAIANDDVIVNSYDITSNDQGFLGIDIQHRNTTLRVNADPDSQYLDASVTARLRERDDVDTESLPPASKVRRVLFSESDIEDFDGTILVLENQPATDDREPIFDGVRVVRPVYAYDSDFSFKDYRIVVTDIVPRMNEAFHIVTDELDIEFTEKESIQSDNDGPKPSPSFH
jgi:hypothetical protein